MRISRRTFSTGVLAGVAALALPGRSRAAVEFGPPLPFSMDALTAWAEMVARMPYQHKPPSNPGIIERIDYDAFQQIRYRADAALWSDRTGPFPVQLFHVGKYFPHPVRMFIVNAGTAREVLYTPELFSYGRAEFARNLPRDVGFAGFRVMYGPNEPDWLAFLGASYFRSSGETRQYGLSAHGLAIDTAMPWPEEFPRFTNFWLEPKASPPGVVVYALLDSPSVAGAYRISATRETGVITEIEAHLFARRTVERLGITPLTSMYWYGKTNRDDAADWRPEIHDSDGLAIWTNTGERIWRPLNNPDQVQTSTFEGSNVRGFGLMQRERRFDQYEDDGVFYEKRPSAWIEPLGSWGEGSVQLVEIPTKRETDDNIVAYWVPKRKLMAGGTLSLRYRIHWRHDEPNIPNIGRVVATRKGIGGIPGAPNDAFVKYVVDFEGGSLGRLTNEDGLRIHVTAPRGRIERTAAYRVVGTNRWRAMFDYAADDKTPIDLRLYLSRQGEALTETWLYQHLPG
jgi:glucans biosynthesis protein